MLCLEFDERHAAAMLFGCYMSGKHVILMSEEAKKAK